MKHYPKERKDAVIAKMANHPSLPQLAEQEGISLPTLYAWRRKAVSVLKLGTSRLAALPAKTRAHVQDIQTTTDRTLLGGLLR